MKSLSLFESLWFVCFIVAAAVMQVKGSTVTLDVTMPNGETRQLNAIAGEQATIKLPDDTEFGFRSTIREADSSQVEVAIIKIGSPDEQLGTVEVKVGESAVDSKTMPAFKIAVSKITPPEE